MSIDEKLTPFFMSVCKDIDIRCEGNGRYILRPMKDLGSLICKDFTLRDLIKACQDGKQYHVLEGSFDANAEYFTANIIKSNDNTENVYLSSVSKDDVLIYTVRLFQKMKYCSGFDFRNLVEKIYFNKDLTEDMINYIFRNFSR